jgi:hypothetical protein
MISYRFLSPAEEEMTEAALFYETTASARLGTDFLDDVQRAIERLRKYPESGESIALDLRRTLLHRFPFSHWKKMQLSSSQ